MNCFILLLTVASAECLKILCLLPYPGKSHHMVFEPLLDELTNRGHELTVVSFFPSNKTNRRDVSLTGAAPLNVEVVDLSELDNRFYGLERLTTHLALNLKLAKMNLELCDTLINLEVFNEFVDGKGDYDVILVEHFNSNCMLGLIHNYGLPFVGLSSCAFLPWTTSTLGGPSNPSYVPVMTLPFTDEMSFFEKLENAFTHLFFDWWFRINIRWEEQKILEKRYARKLPPLVDVAKNMSVLLINTHYTLNGVRVMPPSFVEVGGMHLHNRKAKPLPEDLEKWVSAAKDGFILISFGSLIRGSTLPPNRMRAILEVIGELPQRVIWKWETEHIENLPPNVLLARWLPQYDLLKHPNCVAFITHGGLLSLTEAVSSGVPTLVIAVLGDQFGNAAHANKAYGAPYLTLSELEEDRFREAVKTVLDPEIKSRAKILSSQWHSRPIAPMEAAVFYVEQTARFKHLTMSSHARHMDIIQVTMLDIIGFITALLGLIIVCIVYCCSSKVSKKEKVS